MAEALPAILILAAGAATRMRGDDKLTRTVAGTPLLRRIAAAALATGAPVLVALPPSPGARDAALDGLAVQRVTVADAGDGMGHSIAAGARAAPPDRALMVVPADMALIGAPEMTALIDAHRAGPTRVWRGMGPGGEAGHPVLFPARLVPRLTMLTGDTGARAALADESPVLVPLSGNAAILDLDTPEDWTAFRRLHPG